MKKIGVIVFLLVMWGGAFAIEHGAWWPKRTVLQNVYAAEKDAGAYKSLPIKFWKGGPVSVLIPQEIADFMITSIGPRTLPIQEAGGAIGYLHWADIFRTGDHFYLLTERDEFKPLALAFMEKDRSSYWKYEDVEGDLQPVKCTVQDLDNIIAAYAKKEGRSEH
jgi:hypothetical protein